MDAKLFEKSISGILVPTIEDQLAFRPNKLPPSLDLGSLICEIGEAAAALGGLNKIGQTINNPYMIIRPLQRNEALRSSAMEGTYSTADALAIVEALDDESSDESTREVFNYIKALDYSITQLEALPISHRIITGMHKILLERAPKSRGENKRPGQYKIHQNWIGARQIQEARFVPPTPEDSTICMDQLESFINTEHGVIPPLIAAAMIHYQFETIHPFGDGNRRVGRMLITLFLLDRKLITSPLLYVSPYMDAHKDEYIDTMFAVSAHGHWEAWIKFFLRAVKESCEETSRTITKLNLLQEKYRATLQAKSKSISALTITDRLFEKPVLTIPDAAKVAGISYQAATKNIQALCDLEILRPVAGFENPKLFWAKEVIDISDGVSR